MRKDNVVQRQTGRCAGGRGAWAFALLALMFAREARAQPKDPAVEAKAQFEAGQAAVDKGELRRGRALFLSSLELHPAVGTVLNLADCEEKLGLIASAWQHFKDALPLMRDGDMRITFAKERIAALEPRVPKLRVALLGNAPPGTRILLDSREVNAAKLGTDMPLDPGNYTVTATAPGRTERNYEVKLTEKQRLTLAVEPGTPEARAPIGSMAPANGSAPISPSASPRSGLPSETPSLDPNTSPTTSPLRTAGFVTSAAGIVGITVGTVAGILAIQQKSELVQVCPDPATCSRDGMKLAQDGKTMGTVSTVGLAVGIPLAAAGVVLVLVGHGQRSAEVRAALGPADAGVVVSGTF